MDDYCLAYYWNGNLKKFDVGADLCMCYDDTLQSAVESNVFKDGAYKTYEFHWYLSYNWIGNIIIGHPINN